MSSPSLVVVRGVGPVPIRHQVAGLLVVPAGDPLAAESGDGANRVAAAVALLLASASPSAPTKPTSIE